MRAKKTNLLVTASDGWADRIAAVDIVDILPVCDRAFSVSLWRESIRLNLLLCLIPHHRLIIIVGLHGVLVAVLCLYGAGI